MTPLSRRLFASQVAGTGALLFLPGTALAGIDVSSLKTAPIEGDASGAATRLKQLQMMQQSGNPNDYVSGTRILDSGVSYSDVKAGRDGSRTVRRGSNVGAEVNIRCKSFATANEPRGPIYFSTKQDTNLDEELAWTIGSGDLPKGLEEGMMGMKLNASRRIEVPSQQIFAARNAGQLPEATTAEGKRRYEDLFKTDATLIFEVYVTGINQGDNRI
jgi:FKBP-type peptidyl-prolyl cis-trans isomerase